MSTAEKIVEAITGRRWGKGKQFMALVAVGMMIGQTT